MAILALWQSFRSWIYDFLIIKMTAEWYRRVFVRLPSNAHVLDVGIGTATALLRNADIIREKELLVVGIDIDQDYITMAKKSIEELKLSDRCAVEVVSANDYTGGPFDALYFSGSFMLIPDKASMLRHLCTQLRDQKKDRLYFTQTFHQKNANPLLMWATKITKPLLKFLLTIDFGTVTYEDEFLAVLKEAGVEVEEVEVIKKTIGGETRMVVAKVK